jgi:hypothetical protein
MITGNQIHAARILAGLTRVQAADLAGIGADEVTAMEARGRAGVDARGPGQKALMTALALLGIEFLEGDGPGVRLRPVSGEALQVEDLTAQNDV